MNENHTGPPRKQGPRFHALVVAICLALPTSALAQPAVPPRLADLPKLAEKWPPAWASLARDFAPGTGDFEKEALARVGELWQAEPPSLESYRLAELVLAATLRHHHSVRRGAPPIELEDRLAEVRKGWLGKLPKADALKLVDQWLPAAAKEGPLRTAIVTLWADHARTLAKSEDPAARAWLDRLDEHFPGATQADEVRKLLHEQARTLVKKSPHGTLVVAVPSLPDRLSPATAWTDVERQSLELLFDRLYRVEHKPGLKRYLPQVAIALPGRSLTPAISLRGDVYWSSGERLTAADVWSTASLMNADDKASRFGLWRDFLEIPRLEGNPLKFPNTYQQGLFDPVAPLTFWVLPRFYKGKELERTDDPEFAKAPLGSGPFRSIGADGDKGAVVFQANPYDLRDGPFALHEIRMVTGDPSKMEPKPHLILDAPTDQLPALRKLGYVEKGASNFARVHFLAVNQRKPMLESAAIRLAIAHALDRKSLLDRHFRGDAGGKYHAPANGLFPRDSWGAAPVPRVAEDLFKKGDALALARKAPKPSAPVEWTLKYPAHDSRAKAACEEMAQSLTALFQEASVKIALTPFGLPSQALRKAIHEHDYDLVYTTAEDLDDPVRLALFFDRHDDAKLHELIRGVLRHRQFATVQENMQAVHVHLNETMPAIPLWHLETHVLVQAKQIYVTPLETRAVFGNVRAWKVVP